MKTLKINNEIISDLLFSCTETVNGKEDNAALNLAMYSNGFTADNESSSALLNLARFMEDDSITSIEVTESDGNPVLYSTYYKKLKNIKIDIIAIKFRVKNLSFKFICLNFKSKTNMCGNNPHNKVKM